MAAKLAIMMPPVSVCHQLSWNGWPNASSPQTTASGLRGSPTLARKRSGWRSYFLDELGAGLHHHPNGGRRGVPHGDPLVLQDAVPALGIEVRLVDDAGHAVGQRRDDAVGGPGHPAGIGRAPETCRLGENPARSLPVMWCATTASMDMNRAFGRAGGAAGEVEQRYVFRICRPNSKGGTGLLHEAQSDRVCQRWRWAVGPLR